MTDKTESYISKAPTLTIYDGLVKAKSVLTQHHNILISVSGGADSDNMIDIIEHLIPRDEEHKVTYVWFDTGIEMDATKRHLTYLEERYGIEILRRRAKITVPTAVQKVGQPFYSKEVSTYINNLQRHGFTWDLTREEFEEKYPTVNCIRKWWFREKGKYSISPTLKEFIVKNHPSFSISSKCCQYAKKDTAHMVIEEIHPDLQVIGLRKAEGGMRAKKQSCFDRKHNGIETDRYYPCFWWKDADRKVFEETYGIVHSDAYTVYGFKRTGCAGCPYNSRFEEDLGILRQYEPRLANAVEHIFAPSYEYTRAYREYKKNK